MSMPKNARPYGGRLPHGVPPLPAYAPPPAVVAGPVVYALRTEAFRIRYRPAVGLFDTCLEPRPRRHFADIVNAVAAAFDVDPGDLLSHRRFRRLSRPRQALYLLAKEMTPLSLAAIGRLLRRDHTTLMHGIGTAERLCLEDGDYAHAVETARKSLSEKAGEAKGGAR